MSKYSAYINDVIDKYDNLRKAEHTGRILMDGTEEIIDPDTGLVNPEILPTRLSFANGLEFRNVFEVRTDASFDVLHILEDYGELNELGQPKALRVWSGNDHFLLPEKSAEKYIKALPLDTKITEDSSFVLIYYEKSYDELKQEIENGDFLINSHALLYYDGGEFGGGGGSLVASEEQLTQDLITFDEIQETQSKVIVSDDWPFDTNKYDNNKKEKLIEKAKRLGKKLYEGNEIIEIGPFSEIDHVYLRTAPSHKNFAIGEDDLRLPLYDGILTIVYKNGMTQDVSTYTDFCYAPSLKELRTFERDITETDEKYPFDWTAAGAIYNERRVPFILTNPENENQRIRALDNLDPEISGETREEYVVCIDSKNMFLPETVSSEFKLNALPTKLHLNFTDKEIDITGMEVLQFVPGGATRKYRADDNTLYLKVPEIMDVEMAIANIGKKIERSVYIMDQNGVEKEVITLEFPVSTPDVKDIIKISCIATETEPISDPLVIGDTILKAEIALGCNELDTTEEKPEDRRLRRRTSNAIFGGGRSIWFEALSSLYQSQKENIRTLPYVGPAIEYATTTAQQFDIPGVIASAKSIFDMFKRGKTASKNGWVDFLPPECQRILADIAIKMQGGTVTLGKIRGLKKEKKTNVPANFAWQPIAQIGMGLASNLLNMGLNWLQTKIGTTSVNNKRSSSLYRSKKLTLNDSENVGEWVETNIVPIPEDVVVVGYDEHSTAPIQVVKVITLGQQSLVRLFHEDAIQDEDEIIGITEYFPSTELEVEYNQDDVNEILADAEFIPVNGANELVPVSESEPTLSIEDGDLIAEPVYYEPGVLNGWVDVEISTTNQGMNKLLKRGLKVANCLKDVNGNAVLKGYSRLKVKPKQCKTETTNKLSKFQDALSLNAGKVWDYSEPLDKNGIKISKSNADPDQEAPIFMDVSVGNALIMGSNEDEVTKDIMVEASYGIFFDSNLPEGTAITADTLQSFFNTGKVAVINEDDILEGGDAYDRNYILNGDLELSETIGKEMLEFGNAKFTWKGKEFLLQEGFINVHTHPEYELKMVVPPQNTIYNFGQRKMNLLGASFNLINSNTKEIIYEGLTERNLVCEPLPINVMEIQLEVPDNEEDKTPIKVSFMGYTNEEIRVVLMHPMLAVQEQLKRLKNRNSMDWGQIITACAPVVDSIAGNYFNFLTNFFADGVNVTWPRTTYELAKQMDISIGICDNFQRRKEFNINDLKRETFEKCCTIEGYDPNPGADVKTQEITIRSLGQVVKTMITIAEMVYTTEENVGTNGKIVNPNDIWDWDELPDLIKDEYELIEEPDGYLEQVGELDETIFTPEIRKNMFGAGLYAKEATVFGKDRIPCSGYYFHDLIEHQNRYGLRGSALRNLKNKYLRHNSKESLHTIMKEQNLL